MRVHPSGVAWECRWDDGAVFSCFDSMYSVGNTIDAFEMVDNTRTVSVLAPVQWCMRNKQTPLGPIEEAAFERLRADYEPVDDSFSRETAVTTLEEIDLEASVAHNVLDRLLSKGYLYAVDDELHITA